MSLSHSEMHFHFPITTSTTCHYLNVFHIFQKVNQLRSNLCRSSLLYIMGMGYLLYRNWLPASGDEVKLKQVLRDEVISTSGWRLHMQRHRLNCKQQHLVNKLPSATDRARQRERLWNRKNENLSCDLIKINLKKSEIHCINLHREFHPCVTPTRWEQTQKHPFSTFWSTGKGCCIFTESQHIPWKPQPTNKLSDFCTICGSQPQAYSFHVKYVKNRSEIYNSLKKGICNSNRSK